MAQEEKYAIALTRSNGIGDTDYQREQQAKVIRAFAKEQDFIILDGLEYDVEDNDADGLAYMLCRLLNVMLANPEIGHIVVAHCDVICPSDSLYELFHNHLSLFGGSVEAPEFYEGEEL